MSQTCIERLLFIWAEKFFTYFVDISEMTSLHQIAQVIFEYKDSQVPSYPDREDALARRKFEKLAMKSKPLLLILDDAKEKSVPLIEQLLRIRGYKILVTSGYALPKLKNTYKLRSLREEDAMKLFSHCASIEERFPIPERDVKKVIELSHYSTTKKIFFFIFKVGLSAIVVFKHLFIYFLFFFFTCR